MKKVTVFAVCLIVSMLLSVGSAFAETPLNDTINPLLGTKYKWAGTSTNGFDCSGFTMYVFAQFGVDLPHQSKAQAALGEKVSKDELIPGDLVFFNTGGGGISHVGIYIGDGQFVHSSDDGVGISSLSEKYYARRYVTARRILSDEQYTELTTDSSAK